MKLAQWRRGIKVQQSTINFTYLWFYEWNLFNAVREGQHPPGRYDFDWQVGEREAEMTSDDFHIRALASDDHVDLELTVHNHSDRTWPEIATIIPCFNPGKEGEVERNDQLMDLDHARTYFVGKDGLSLLKQREIHFNQQYREQIDREADPEGKYVFSEKWPTDPQNAEIGALIRESDDGQYVAGIVWDEFLSAQGHNPWTCMHLSVRVGALAPDESVTRKGRIYLFEGNASDCLERCRAFLDT
jgi:hypothetical protein